jgi:hypothetical protein
MADGTTFPPFQTIPDLPPASGLNFTDQVWINQAGLDVRANLGDIAALMPAHVVSFNGRTGDVALQIGDITGAGGAPLSSPVLEGVPQAPTPPRGATDTRIATAEFVQDAISSTVAGVASFNGRVGAVTLTTADITGAGAITHAVTSVSSASGDLSVANPTTTPALTVLSAPKWSQARIVNYTGDVTGTNTVDGSANVTTPLTIAPSGVAAGTYGDATHIPAVTVNAKGLVTGVTLIPTPPPATGTVSSVGLTVPTGFAVAGSPVTGAGTLAISFTAQPNNVVLAGPATGGPLAPTWRQLTQADIAGGVGVTSVGLTMPALFGVSGSPVTGAGGFTVTIPNQGQNLVWAGPTTGGPGQPAFRPLTLADMPAGLATGTVNSVGLALPNIFTVTGSPVTGSGTLTGALATQAAGTIFAAPVAGGVPSFRALQTSDLPSLSYLPLAGGTLTGPLNGTAVHVGTTFRVGTNNLSSYSNTAQASIEAIGDGVGAGLNASRFSTDASGPVINGLKARGTLAAPVAVVSGDFVNQFQAQAYDGSAFQLVAAILSQAQTYTAPGNLSGALYLQTRTAGPGGALANALTIDQVQNATFAGTTTTFGVAGSGAVANPTQIRLDGSYATASGGPLKLDLFGGNGQYGIGLSSGNMYLNAGAAAPTAEFSPTLTTFHQPVTGLSGFLVNPPGVTQFTLAQRPPATGNPNAAFYPTTPNTLMNVALYPNGVPPGGTGASLLLFDSDLFNTTTTPNNYLQLTTAADANRLVAGAQNGATQKPFAIRVGTVDALTIDATQTVTLIHPPVWPAVNQNRFWASPVGASAAPAFRKLDVSDMPALTTANLTDIIPPTAFTPTVSFGTTVGDLAVSYTVQRGSWSAVGKLTHVEVNLSCTLTYTTSAGALIVLLPGLPLPPSSGAVAPMGVVVVGHATGWTGYLYGNIAIVGGVAAVFINQVPPASFAQSLTVANVPSGATVYTVQINIDYSAA